MAQKHVFCGPSLMYSAVFQVTDKFKVMQNCATSPVALDVTTKRKLAAVWDFLFIMQPYFDIKHIFLKKDLISDGS